MIRNEAAKPWNVVVIFVPENIEGTIGKFKQLYVYGSFDEGTPDIHLSAKEILRNGKTTEKANVYIVESYNDEPDRIFVKNKKLFDLIKTVPVEKEKVEDGYFMLGMADDDFDNIRVYMTVEQ